MRKLLADDRLFPIVFLTAFVALDWVTFIHEAPAINVTPWNPPAGLYVAPLLLARRHAALLAFAALMLGDVIVRGMPAPLPLLVLTNLLIVGVYAAGAWLLTRRLGLRPALDRLYDLVWLVVAVPIGAAAAAFSFTFAYAVAGVLPWHGLPAVTLQYWVGDVIGILAVTPALLVLLHGTASAGLRPPPLETLAQGAAVAAGLLVTFNPLVPDPSKIFYVLFLPVIWVAMRRGLPGATAAILATQIGLVVGLQTRHGGWNDLTYYQMMMVALAATGLLIGAVVSERWRLERALRDRQAELARVGRLSLLGEMASSLAHELNQPLFTTVGYTKASRRLLLRDGDRAAIVDLMNRAVAEAERAADVLRGIRGFLRQGGRATRIDLAAAVAEVVALAAADAQRQGVTISVALPPALPALWADQVEIDQVLLNLLRNSIDALASTADRAKEIRVSAKPLLGMVEISVEDNGPGIPDDKVGPLFDLFFTTKPSGMGLGLPICRSIIESHGGKLWLARNGADGSCFSFTLPAMTK